jgi:VanZ family protein
MALIFVGSTNVLSAGQTSRIIGPLLRWFDPQVTVETIRAVQMVIRKGGHLAEYAILAVLIRRARGIGAATGFRAWRGDEFATCLLLAALYAFSDEFHQSFESNREGRLGDVVIDTLGAAVGLLAWHVYRGRLGATRLEERTGLSRRDAGRYGGKPAAVAPTGTSTTHGSRPGGGA